ncbi:serine/threonine-protein phosphatase 6 regulatory ankyrin repeat subunit B-like [Haliotis rubra]|uniref:serine/threonine-protein phosphatase 6 regulatory ankyrin repeat subunit B-like n=1 Tax=Haliotis rubra TaxID=36100 RepID=UPI001EE50EDA|nr:serine/threonine-protein phosphatase 6 regulatory ankyrin repeat subunit B-like [Haliotis rubra]
MARRMTRGKADVSVERNWEILTESVTTKDIRVVREWFKHNTSLHGRGSEFPEHLRDPVFVAVGDGSKAIFTLLLRHGFQVNRLTRGKRRNLRPVHIAAKCGQLEMLMTLLSDHDVPVDTEDSCHRTPFAYAVEGNHTDVVQYLLSQGADCDRPSPFLSPLVSAVNGNKLSLVTVLTQHGANVNCRVSEDGCLLNKCARLNYVDMMQILYNNGARVDIRDKNKGFGILHFALHKPVNMKVLKFLIKVNAPLNQVCSEGRSALLGMLSSKDKLFHPSRYIRLLVEAGYNVTRSEYDAACNVHTDCESLQLELQNYLSSTWSLQQLACFKVRHILGADLPKRVHDLPLPEQVKEYVQLKHLTD